MEVRIALGVPARPGRTRRDRVDQVAGAVLQIDLPLGGPADVVLAPGRDGTFRVCVEGLSGAEAILVADFAERLVRTRGTMPPGWY